MSSKNRSTDQVTLLVFRGNHAARSFNVPLAWISRLGLIAGALLATTLISLFFAAKSYNSLRYSNPSHVEALEHELADLKAAYTALENKKPEPLTTQAQAPSLPTSSAATPAIQAQTPPPAQNTPSSAQPTGNLRFPFATLPADALQPASSGPVPVSIDSPKLKWDGRTLRLRFNIHYSLNDGGAQQGRIALLARGPKTILAYPAGILTEAGADTLIDPDQGEYFSVSRFREVKTDFGPLSSSDSLKTVEIFLFNDSGQLLLHYSLRPESKTETKTRVAPGKPAKADQPQTPAVTPEAPPQISSPVQPSPPHAPESQ